MPRALPRPGSRMGGRSSSSATARCTWWTPTS